MVGLFSTKYEKIERIKMLKEYLQDKQNNKSLKSKVFKDISKKSIKLILNLCNFNPENRYSIV